MKIDVNDFIFDKSTNSVRITLARCNLRCDFCHNADLSRSKKAYNSVDLVRKAIQDICIQSNQPITVMISGGEPMLQEIAIVALLEELMLTDTCDRIKKIEIHVNGTMSLDSFRQKLNRMYSNESMIHMRSKLIRIVYHLRVPSDGEYAFEMSKKSGTDLPRCIFESEPLSNLFDTPYILMVIRNNEDEQYCNSVMKVIEQYESGFKIQLENTQG